jgi:transcriptional regulator with XRE-family HTH domain
MRETADSPGPSSFGRWLYEVRKKKGISVDQLAEDSGVSFVQVYNIESGRSQNPQPKTREKLTNALGTRPAAKVLAETKKEASVRDVGEFVDFDPHDDTNIPDEPGVYVFYDISDRPIYVGQSKSIRDRIVNDHVTRFWYRAPVVQNASYVRIEDEGLRAKIEKVMIKFLKSNAVINKQGVDRGAHAVVPVGGHAAREKK